MSSPTSTSMDATRANAAEERSARVAVVVFPILVIMGGLLGYLFAPSISQGAALINPMLGLIMFCMGLTLRPVDFALVIKRPVPVVVGVMAQYVLMPAIAVFVCWVLQLPPELAAGVILVGCAPGGTSSNVISFLSRGDVALSVTMTSVSTLLAPLLTPMLTLWLAGQYMPLNGGSMALSILQIVLGPVVAGIVVRLVLNRFAELVLPILPWLSVLLISAVVAVVVSRSADKIIQAGLLVLVAVIIHNLLGYALGYLVGRVTGQPIPARRTTAVEVGMQNSGLAAALAAQYMSPVSALPGAVFSVWHNISGALLALLCRMADQRAARREIS